MKAFRKWPAWAGLASLLLMVPAVGASTSGPEVESAGGTAAAILCGVYMAMAGPVAGIIAGLISSCGWLLFDAIFL